MNANKLIAMEVCRAQAASDKGKDIADLTFKGTWDNSGYTAKNQHIINAIQLIKSAGKHNWYYFVNAENDQNGCPSVIVYFEYGGYQISFHSPWRKAKDFIPLIGTGRKTEWNGVIGGSREACRQLIKEYHLSKV